MPFALSTPTTLALQRGRNALDAEISEHREEFEERSERWRDGDTGAEVDAWLEELGDLVDTIDALDTRRRDGGDVRDDRPDVVELRKLMQGILDETHATIPEADNRVDDVTLDAIATAILARMP